MQTRRGGTVAAPCKSAARRGEMTRSSGGVVEAGGYMVFQSPDCSKAKAAL